MTARWQWRPLNMGRMKGYSLMEMVTVTTILGGLGAVAVPRYVDWTTEARVAVVRSMEGAVHTASTMVHAACVVKGRCDEATLAVGNGDVVLTHGYPAGGAASGIAAALEHKGFDVQHLADATVFRQQGAPEPARCAVTYLSPVSPGDLPRIDSELSGC